MPSLPPSPTQATAGRYSPSLTYAQVLVRPNTSSITSPDPMRHSPSDTPAPASTAALDGDTVLTGNTPMPIQTEFARPYVVEPECEPATQATPAAGRNASNPGKPLVTTNGEHDIVIFDTPTLPATQVISSTSDLGKRVRIGSPTPSMTTMSPPALSKTPRRASRGKKAARMAPPSPLCLAVPNDVFCPSPLMDSSPPATPTPKSSTTMVQDADDLSTHLWRRDHPMSGLAASPASSGDISMRTASPLDSDWEACRIPRHAKGKEPQRQSSPGPSRHTHPLGLFLDRTPNPTPVRRLWPPAPPPHFCPNDSTYSVYPPVLSPTQEASPPQSPRYRNRYDDLHDDHYLRHQNDANSQFPCRTRSSDNTQSNARPHDSPGNDLSGPDILPDPPSNLANFVRQTEVHAPAENDDFLTFTPVPPGGFPAIHMSTPLGLFDNVDESQLLDWERERAKGRVVVGTSFYGHGALDGDVDPRFRQLLSYAAHLLNARFHTNRIMIASPRPKSPVTTLNSPPFTALIYGVTQDEADILLSDGTMATPRLGLFFHRLDIIFPSYVGAIHGLTTRLIHPVYELVVEHFLSDEAATLFRDLTSAAPQSTILPENAQVYFVNSLYVRRLDCRARGNTLTPVFLIYLDSPAFDYLSHRTWTNFCRTINLSHSLYGSGRLQSPGTCAGCHGQDHPTGLCRLPQVAKWCAPAPFTTPNFAIPSHPSSSLSATVSQPRQQANRQARGGTNERGRRRRGGRRNA